ncbi:hypothetical protein [Plantactinospora sp. DSM 117369]
MPSGRLGFTITRPGKRPTAGLPLTDPSSGYDSASPRGGRL